MSRTIEWWNRTGRSQATRSSRHHLKHNNKRKSKPKQKQKNENKNENKKYRLTTSPALREPLTGHSVYNSSSRWSALKDAEEKSHTRLIKKSSRLFSRQHSKLNTWHCHTRLIKKSSRLFSREHGKLNTWHCHTRLIKKWSRLFSKLHGKLNTWHCYTRLIKKSSRLFSRQHGKLSIWHWRLHRGNRSFATLIRLYLWWNFCTLYLLVCQVRASGISVPCIYSHARWELPWAVGVFVVVFVRRLSSER